VAVLVTRPEPDNQVTAATLQQRGFDVLLAPLLQFEPLPFRSDDSVQPAGVIATSANALRAIANHPLRDGLIELPLFAVGARTAEAARTLGFANVLSADGDVAALRRLIVGSLTKAARKAPLLRLAGSDAAGDIAADLASDAIAVATLTVYRMIPINRFPDDVRTAFAAHAIEAVLHYSPRSAAAFVAAVRDGGLEIAGLAVLQICMSDAVARILREAGAPRLVVAASPQETAMIDALERSLRRP
jgi:uroporphyrinogen-III synthase